MSAEDSAPEKTAIRRQGSSLMVPETELEFPSFPTLERDWARLRRRVADLANPIPWARDLGWSCVSLAAAFLLALVPWIPAYGQLPPSGQLGFAWVSPCLVVGAVAAIIVAVLSFVMHANMEKVVKRDVKHVLEDIDEIHPQLSAAVSGGVPAARSLASESSP
jgi:hypothetical protein